MASPISPVISPKMIPSTLPSPVLLPHSPRELRIKSPRLSTTSTQGLSRTNSRLLPSTSSISLLSLSFANTSIDSEEQSSSLVAPGSNSGSRSGSFSGSSRSAVVSPGSSPHVHNAFHNRISHYQRSLRSPSTAHHHYTPSQLASIPNSPELGPVSLSSSPSRINLSGHSSSAVTSPAVVISPGPISIPVNPQSPTLSPVGTPGEPMTPMVLETSYENTLEHRLGGNS